MVTFTAIDRQLTLFDYQQMLHRTRIPIKRITRARYDQALHELRGGKSKSMLTVLQDINEALEKYNRRLTNGKLPTK